jgi:hypothetical protein
MNVALKRVVLRNRLHSILIEAGCPHARDAELFMRAKRKRTFDQLHGFFQRNVCRRGHEQVHVIGHEHEGMQEEFISPPMMSENFDEELLHASRLKDVATAI